MHINISSLLSTRNATSRKILLRRTNKSIPCILSFQSLVFSNEYQTLLLMWQSLVEIIIPLRILTVLPH